MNKGSIGIVVAVIFTLLVLGGGTYYVGTKKGVVATSTPTVVATTVEPVMCTADAKLCPDGSYVGRTGPKCEFAVCPPTIPMEPSLFIKEWNVRLPLSKSITDLEYRFVDDGRISLFAKDLVSTYICQSEPNHKGTIGSMARYDYDPLKRAADFDLASPTDDAVVKLGKYWYVYWHNQDYCSSNFKLENSKIDSITSALQQLVEI